MAKKKTDYSKYAIIIIALIMVGVIAYAIISIFTGKEKTEFSIVMATVNGEPITEQQVDKRFKYLSAQQGPTVRKDYAFNYTINQVILMQEAKKQGITVDNQKIVDGIEQWIEEIKTQLPPEQLALQLASQNMTLEEFRNDSIELYTENFIVFKLLNRTVFSTINITLDSSVTEQEMLSFFEANKENYDRVDASHVLVCFNGAISCKSNRTKEEALERIKTVQGKIKENGKFEELATKYSDDPSVAENNGSLGFFSRADMVKPFADAAFALKYPNQVSDIIETDFGYHLIKLNAKKEGYEAFKKEINMQLQLNKQQEAQAALYQTQSDKVGDYLKQLRGMSDIRYYAANPNIKVSGGNPMIQTFSVKEGEICRDETGKPVIRLFSTTTCPHCVWVKEGFDKTVQKYVSEGKIVAYHWEMDSGDNTLTEFKETYLPESERNLYNDFNDRRTIPTFIFGCKYYRIGNGYEGEDGGIGKEQREFEAIIEELLK